jgi:glycerophosphoryl diester phosphodiesterase
MARRRIRWKPSRPPAAAGYGIELDVQLSADGEAMVFHDDDLARMTGVAGRMSDRTAADLAELRLAGTDERIPTLLEALAVIGHHAMVHVELKTPPGRVGPLEQRTHDVIDRSPRSRRVIGFNPYSHAWFAERFPGVLRGLDSYSWRDAPHVSAEQRKAFAKLEQVSLARRTSWRWASTCPAERRGRQAHRAKGMPVVAWTVRDPAQWDAIKGDCDNLIFEGFRP